MKIIAGSSNLPFTQKLAQFFSAQLVDCEIDYFQNKEKRVWIKDKVGGEEIVLVQSFSHPVDELIVETLLLVDALERAGTRKVHLVIPWMGYSLQDKVFRPGEPIAAKVLANLISNTFVKRVYLLDLHNSSIPGFFSVPTEHLSALETFAHYAEQNFDLNQAVVASPDFGGLKKARDFAQRLGLDLTNVDKERDLKTGQVTAHKVHGQIKDKIVVLFDDVIMSGGTVVEVSKLLKDQGAKEVHFLVTHGVFCDNAINKIKKSVTDSVVITNSIAHRHLDDKIKTLDISQLFGQALSKWL